MSECHVCGNIRPDLCGAPSKCPRVWNEMSPEHRSRLQPYMIDSHILHLQQVRTIIVKHHQAELRELDKWIQNLKEDLRKDVPHGKGEQR